MIKERGEIKYKRADGQIISASVVYIREQGKLLDIYTYEDGGLKAYLYNTETNKWYIYIDNPDNPNEPFEEQFDCEVIDFYFTKRLV